MFRHVFLVLFGRQAGEGMIFEIFEGHSVFRIKVDQTVDHVTAYGRHRNAVRQTVDARSNFLLQFNF